MISQNSLCSYALLIHTSANVTFFFADNLFVNFDGKVMKKWFSLCRMVRDTQWCAMLEAVELPKLARFFRLHLKPDYFSHKVFFSSMAIDIIWNNRAYRLINIKCWIKNKIRNHWLMHFSF